MEMPVCLTSETPAGTLVIVCVIYNPPSGGILESPTGGIGEGGRDGNMVWFKLKKKVICCHSVTVFGGDTPYRVEVQSDGITCEYKILDTQSSRNVQFSSVHFQLVGRVS